MPPAERMNASDLREWSENPPRMMDSRGTLASLSNVEKLQTDSHSKCGLCIGALLRAQTNEAKFYFSGKISSCKIMQSKHIETYTTKDINHEDQRKEYGQAKRLSKSSPHLLETK